MHILSCEDDFDIRHGTHLRYQQEFYKSSVTLKENAKAGRACQEMD